MEPWPILLVCLDPARVAEVRRAVSALPVPVELTVACSAMSALRRALAQPSRLVIVDWAIDGAGGPALVRQLARVRPTLPVLAFDILAIKGTASQVLAWQWDELAIVLNVWFLRALERKGAT